MLKKKPKEPEAAPEPSLADRIRATCAEAEAYVEQRAREIKSRPEGQLLPLDWIRLNVRATTRAGGCHCKAALALLEEKKNG
jgi:hypothetical protein